MKAVHALVALLILPVAGFAAGDDYKVIKLEQDVRRLEQQVRDLSRQVAELRRGVPTSVDQAPAPTARETDIPQIPPRWLRVKNWQSVKLGMSELQVIDTLGAPTSTRASADGETQILFYAMEIATGSFVGGSVELRDRRVVQINVPMLK